MVSRPPILLRGTPVLSYRIFLSAVCLAVMLVFGSAPRAVAQSANDENNQQHNSNIPSPEFLLALVRSTIIAIDNGMMTGNFTVLRDMGVPRFASQNSPTTLGVAFKSLMDKGIRFRAAAITTPTLTVAPFINKDNALVLEGKFPTRPLEINFVMSFQVYQGGWRLASLNIGTSQAPATAEASESSG